MREINWSLVDSPYKGPVIQKVLPCHNIMDFMDGILKTGICILYGVYAI